MLCFHPDLAKKKSGFSIVVHPLFCFPVVGGGGFVFLFLFLFFYLTFPCLIHFGSTVFRIASLVCDSPMSGRKQQVG